MDTNAHYGGENLREPLTPLRKSSASYRALDETSVQLLAIVQKP